MTYLLLSEWPAQIQFSLRTLSPSLGLQHSLQCRKGFSVGIYCHDKYIKYGTCLEPVFTMNIQTGIFVAADRTWRANKRNPYFSFARRRRGSNPLRDYQPETNGAQFGHYIFVLLHLLNLNVWFSGIVFYCFKKIFLTLTSQVESNKLKVLLSHLMLVKMIRVCVINAPQGIVFPKGNETTCISLLTL
jgi:hypothetical protein